MSLLDHVARVSIAGKSRQDPDLTWVIVKARWWVPGALATLAARAYVEDGHLLVSLMRQHMPGDPYARWESIWERDRGIP